MPNKTGWLVDEISTAALSQKLDELIKLRKFESNDFTFSSASDEMFNSNKIFKQYLGHYHDLIKNLMKILVTGSSGLIGSEVCSYFEKHGNQIYGIDNNQRAVFFGPQGDTSWRLKELKAALPSFSHHELDIRDRFKVLNIIKEIKPDAIVHTAAQPSHDKAASIPFDDFDVNAVGTLNLLEACRQVCPDSPFVHMSTNKVYGDGPNSIKLKELGSRWEYDDPDFAKGIPETFPSINANTLYLGLPRLRPMLWYRNMAGILAWQLVAYVEVA